MSEKEFNNNEINSSDIYSHSEAEKSFNDNYNDSYSDKQPTAEFDVQSPAEKAPVEAVPVYRPAQPEPVKYHRPYGYGYESYTSQFESAKSEAENRKKSKKSKSGSEAKVYQSCEQQNAYNGCHDENREEFHDFVNDVESHIL